MPTDTIARRARPDDELISGVVAPRVQNCSLHCPKDLALKGACVRVRQCRIQSIIRQRSSPAMHVDFGL